MKGILADVNAIGPIEYLVKRMQAEPWTEFWQELGLVLRRFSDVGLAANSSDLDIWRRCQEEQLIFITDNRNDDGPDSLEASLRQHNTVSSLPVFTIANLSRFRHERSYADRVLEMLYDYLLRIDAVRGVGRLYLP